MERIRLFSCVYCDVRQSDGSVSMWTLIVMWARWWQGRKKSLVVCAGVSRASLRRPRSLRHLLPPLFLATLPLLRLAWRPHWTQHAYLPHAHVSLFLHFLAPDNRPPPARWKRYLIFFLMNFYVSWRLKKSISSSFILLQWYADINKYSLRF